MPTNRPRFQVTETEDVERALRVAERAWPEASRADRVTRLLSAGADAVQRAQDERRRRRLSAIDATAGTFDVEPGYLDQLRDDWPA